MLKRGVVEKFWRQPDVLAGHFPYVEIAAIPPLIFTHRMAYNCLGELLAQGDRDYWHILISQFDLSIPFLPIFIIRKGCYHKPVKPQFMYGDQDCSLKPGPTLHAHQALHKPLHGVLTRKAKPFVLLAVV